MSEKRTTGNNSRAKAKMIFTRLRQGNLPKDLHEQIAGWLLVEDNEEKEGCLSELFDEVFEYERAPDKKALDMYSEFLHMSGIEPAGKPKILLHKVVQRIAAVLLLLLAVGAALLLWDRGRATESKPAMVTVSVPADTTQRILLADGSVVRLKGPGTIEYPEDFVVNRSVNLTGRAIFCVAHDEEHPFRVHAEELNVEVLGTVFSMVADNDRPKAVVSLLEGSLQVDYAGETVVLEPSQKFIYDKATDEVCIDHLDVEQERKKYTINKLSMDGLALRDAFRRVGEFKRVPITIEEGFAPDHLVKATFSEYDSVENMLWILQTLTGAFDYEVDDGGVRIFQK